MSILCPRQQMGRGRTKSTSHWPGTPSSTRFSWSPTQRTQTTLCASNAVFLPHPHWLFWPRDLFQSGLRVRECSLTHSGYGVSRNSHRLICNQCFKAENESRDCVMEGCGNKRHGEMVYCKSCRNLNAMCQMSCFLCGEGITRDVGNTKRGKKAGIRTCIGKTKWIASIGALHTRAESAERKGEMMVGA